MDMENINIGYTAPNPTEMFPIQKWVCILLTQSSLMLIQCVIYCYLSKKTRNRCPSEMVRFTNAFRGTVSHKSPNQLSNNLT